MHLHYQSEISFTNMIVLLPCYLDPLWYKEEGIVNTLSLSNITSPYKVTCDHDKYNTFTVHKDKSLRFTETPKGPFHIDTSINNELMLVTIVKELGNNTPIENIPRPNSPESCKYPCGTSLLKIAYTK